ncbi:MAG: hypothetical protein LBB09_00070 [Rickettsiales bacterium]|jgi:outer membrane protein assembly factor BamE (lipoprotein component of BamABCDE complex)|nr:hypothetical protein [Rickettsiales bacterium]
MKKILIISVGALLSSCVQGWRGFYFSENAVKRAKNLDAYCSTKEDVANDFGQPSLELEDGTWLYYSYAYKNPPFKKNKIGEDKILLVYFDDKEKISKYSFRERAVNGNIANIGQMKKKTEGNIFREFFRGLIFTPIGNGGADRP